MNTQKPVFKKPISVFDFFLMAFGIPDADPQTDSRFSAYKRKSDRDRYVRRDPLRDDHDNGREPYGVTYRQNINQPPNQHGLYPFVGFSTPLPSNSETLFNIPNVTHVVTPGFIGQFIGLQQVLYKGYTRAQQDFFKHYRHDLRGIVFFNRDTGLKYILTDVSTEYFYFRLNVDGSEDTGPVQVSARDFLEMSRWILDNPDPEMACQLNYGYMGLMVQEFTALGDDGVATDCSPVYWHNLKSWFGAIAL